MQGVTLYFRETETDYFVEAPECLDTQIFEPMYGPRGIRHIAISMISFVAVLDDIKNASTSPEDQKHVYQILELFPDLEDLTILDVIIPRDSEGVDEDYGYGPYKLKDLKLVEFKDTAKDTWEELMGSVLEWHDCVKENCPAFAPIKVRLAGVEETFLPGQHQSKYIRM